MRFLILMLTASLLSAEPVRVIFDTDMGNDVDDAIALALLHALENRGESKLLAVTLTKDNRLAAPYCDLVNHFYGRGGIPIGVVRNGKTPKDGDMIRIPAERRAADGRLVYPRRLFDGSQAMEAAVLIRDILRAQPDQSVVIIQVGFSSNLARLLDSAEDRELVARKVRLLSAMAGAFPTGKAEYNVHTDVPAAQKVFGEWPTPIVASGWEVGSTILYPAASIERDFAYVEHHPVADAYRAYKKMPYDRPTWDPTSALYAVRPNHGYFSLSEPGRIRVDDQGFTTFAAQPGGKHHYLVVDDAQRARIRELFIELASEPPRNFRAQ